MALSATSFSSASMVAKVKAGMQEAITDGMFGQLDNRAGGPICTVVYLRRQGFTFWRRGCDITQLVMQGARIYHAAQQEQQQ
ncbi:hypothetical protein PssvBMR16_gp04 [Pseudomonas phage MR16]|nr:hypothetical protein PssvBMR16_gp04 [Pseudomonas phage MR16]